RSTAATKSATKICTGADIFRVSSTERSKLISDGRAPTSQLAPRRKAGRPMSVSGFRVRLLLAAVATGVVAASATQAPRVWRPAPAINVASASEAAGSALRADFDSLPSTADAVPKDLSEITGLPIKAPLKNQ